MEVSEENGKRFARHSACDISVNDGLPSFFTSMKCFWFGLFGVFFKWHQIWYKLGVALLDALD